MHDDSATLLLTRPRARSEEFLMACESRHGQRLPSVISPVIEIVDHGDLPDVDAYSCLIFTSGNAVRRLGLAGRLRGCRVLTVGEQTAKLAESFGADAVCLGPDIETFIKAKPDVGQCALHCRGVHARGDLAARLTASGAPCNEAIVYDQVANPLTGAARAILGGQGRVILPLFSPRSASLVAAAGPPVAPATIIAMSDAVARAWPLGGDIHIAQEPSSEAMCDAVLDAF